MVSQPLRAGCFHVSPTTVSGLASEHGIYPKAEEWQVMSHSLTQTPAVFIAEPQEPQLSAERLCKASPAQHIQQECMSWEGEQTLLPVQIHSRSLRKVPVRGVSQTGH